MNDKLSDKVVITIMLFTVFLVFFIAFSIKSPERKLYNEPLQWKDDISINSSNDLNNNDFDNIYTNL